MSTSPFLQDAPPITRNEVVNEVSYIMDEAKGFDSGVSIDSWQHYIVTSTGAPDQVAIKVFEKIVFRHRGIKLKQPQRVSNNIEHTHKPSFEGELWRCDVGGMAKKLNYSRQTISDAIKRLEALGLVIREYDRKRWPYNAEYLYVTPVPEALRIITKPLERLPESLGSLTGFRGSQHGGREEFFPPKSLAERMRPHGFVRPHRRIRPSGRGALTSPRTNQNVPTDDPSVPTDESVRPETQIKNKEVVEEVVPPPPAASESQRIATSTSRAKQADKSAPPSAEASPSLPASHLTKASLYEQVKQRLSTSVPRRTSPPSLPGVRVNTEKSHNNAMANPPAAAEPKPEPAAEEQDEVRRQNLFQHLQQAQGVDPNELAAALAALTPPTPPTAEQQIENEIRRLERSKKGFTGHVGDHDAKCIAEIDDQIVPLAAQLPVNSRLRKKYLPGKAQNRRTAASSAPQPEAEPETQLQEATAPVKRRGGRNVAAARPQEPPEASQDDAPAAVRHAFAVGITTPEMAEAEGDLWLADQIRNWQSRTSAPAASPVP